ncbi:NUDIX hydrolase [Actinocorallia populi]|uniref:NUDIX hydrolase n=1 Tax=Actinocorallia populi TaxID=2079200 RepID=UPI000D09273E|nr:NUDIX domain-containing protein [Actinocorallia populi]
MELDVVAWIHVREKRLLTVRARGRDLLYLPGGKVEPGESPAEAVAREVTEELGLNLPPRDFTPLGTVVTEPHDQPRYTSVRMVCFTAPYTGPLHPSAEIDELLLVSPGDRRLLAPASEAALDLALAHGLLAP